LKMTGVAVFLKTKHHYFVLWVEGKQIGSFSLAIKRYKIIKIEMNMASFWEKNIRLGLQGEEQNNVFTCFNTPS
jgi:uncharacterized protein YlbG (UPF0298 family)